MRCNDRFKSHSRITDNQYNNRYMTFEIIRIHKIIFLKLNKHNRSGHVHHRRCPPPDSRFLVRSRYSISVVFTQNEPSSSVGIRKWADGKFDSMASRQSSISKPSPLSTVQSRHGTQGKRWSAHRWLSLVSFRSFSLCSNRDSHLFPSVFCILCYKKKCDFRLSKSRIMPHSVGRSLQPSSRCGKFA